MKDVEIESSSKLEVWKPINRFEGKYWVSNLGRVKSKRGIRKFSTTRDGYHRVVLYVENSKKITISLHKIVAIAFIEKVISKPHINHINGIKKDNRAENLEWCTPKENTNHAIKIGLIDLSPQRFNKSNKLSEDSVKEIFKSNSSYLDLMSKYNVGKSSISAIKTGRTWSYVTGAIYVKKWVRKS